ncbi:MAG: hypothetical protein FWC97_01240 [Treponema sp.]|nr:hypothetical protein [Treponema sp.]
MKKIIIVLVIMFCMIGTSFAQDIQISGEMRTGLFWYSFLRDDMSEPETQAFIHNSEDVNWMAGHEGFAALSANLGRFRLNFQYDLNDNLGVKFRFESTQWLTGEENRFFWGYAFAFGYFFNNGVKISAGRMGDSPWGTGGPELWRELDTTLGMRFEFIPQRISFITPGSLNFGFVLNNFDGNAESIVDPQWPSGDLTLTDILTESVVGISYTHDFFHFRFAYRFDGLFDGPPFERLLFRVEERVLDRLLPGFQIFANGYWNGLNPRNLTLPDEETDAIRTGINWLFLQYDPDWMLAQVRVGYFLIGDDRRLAIRPGLHFRLFDNLLQVGAAFEYAMELAGLRSELGAPYLYWFFEPQVRLNLAGTSHISLVYRYQSDYWFAGDGLGFQNTRTHWVNLRLTFTF